MSKSTHIIASILATFISFVASAQGTDTLGDLYNVVNTGGRPSGFVSVGGGVNSAREAVGTWSPTGSGVAAAFFWDGNSAHTAAALTPLQ